MKKFDQYNIKINVNFQQDNSLGQTFFMRLCESDDCNLSNPQKYALVEYLINKNRDCESVMSI